MPQIGFGSDTCKTCQENGYDLYIKKDDFQITPMAILIGFVIVLAIIFLKKTQTNTKSYEDYDVAQDSIDEDYLLENRKKELIEGTRKIINFTNYALKNLNIALNVTNTDQLKNDINMIQAENTKMMKFIHGENQKDIFQGKSIYEVNDIDEILDVLFERIIEFDRIARSAYIKHFNGDENSYDENFK